MILILSALLYSGQGLMKGPVSFKTLRFTTAQDTDGNVVSVIIFFCTVSHSFNVNLKHVESLNFTIIILLLSIGS